MSLGYCVMMPKAPDSMRAAERERMVEVQLRRRGIRSQRVLEALLAAPREWFMPDSLASRAYDDSALPIWCGQTISQPYIVAKMSELLDPGPKECVLEIGTGSGYQTAILAMLAGHVYTIEWHLALMTPASERLARLGVSNVDYRCADGSLGWAERAPFDAIMVTAGGPEVPAALRGQLCDGGRLVMPVGPVSRQDLVMVRRRGQTFEQSVVLECRFVKLRGAGGWRD